jgi:hypothetical protein
MKTLLLALVLGLSACGQDIAAPTKPEQLQQVVADSTDEGVMLCEDCIVTDSVRPDKKRGILY